MLVAILIVTVNFAAVFTIPGECIRRDTASKEDWGLATMLDKRELQIFAIFSAIAMICSLIAVINLMLAEKSDCRMAIVATMRTTMLLKIAVLAIAFLAGVILTYGKLPLLFDTALFGGSFSFSFSLSQELHCLSSLSSFGTTPHSSIL
ncbi:hypothetical protein NL676_010841 [Syzygium grande]|nr:hypothetical protein NL676_010841 [Syzygium grande]